jgi:predicted permease
MAIQKRFKVPTLALVLSLIATFVFAFIRIISHNNGIASTLMFISCVVSVIALATIIYKTVSTPQP